MLAETGYLLLILALAASLLQTALPLYGAAVGDRRLMAFGDRAALFQALCVTLAFGLLTVLFITSDFSVALVYNHSHTLKPFLYKISGVWGNHEGSMLLWVMILALFGGAVAAGGRNIPETFRARVIGVQGALGIGFLAFLVLTSNPFERLDPAPVDGSGLNPLLQDPGLALHPPFLYLGYVGFSLAFSFAVAALIEGRVDPFWARWVRPWALAAWSFLTIGITLGSVWAYYELGWGGWWFWDPVENVSFMPWLAGTALLHSVMVVEKRQTLAHWSVLLAIATFSLSLIGTFVVRSGLLTSVHAFAVDPDRGIFILALIAIYTGIALTLYAIRANVINSETRFSTVSREGGLMANNLLLMLATAVVFLGTFYPLAIEALSNGRDRVSFGPDWYNISFAPVMGVLILFMAVAPLLRWRSDSLSRFGKPLMIMAVAGFGALVASLIIGRDVWGAIGMALAAWLLIGALAGYARKMGLGQRSLGDMLKLVLRLPGSVHGFALAHIGMAITTAGAVAMSIWVVEVTDRLQVGESMEVAGHTYTLERVEMAPGPNYQALLARITVTRGDEVVTTLIPERRFYPVEEQMTTEAGMEIGVFRTLFAALGDGTPEEGYLVTGYYHPLVTWIWFGALLMAMGGLWATTDRRRVHNRVPQRARPDPTPDLSPAE